jgi:polysaccharide export outer membrane protein
MTLTGLKRFLGWSAMMSVVAFLAGCASEINPGERYSFPYGAPPTPDNPTGKPVDLDPGQYSKLRVGDLIIVTFSDLPNPLPRQEINIPDGGMIALPNNVRVQAAGKTTTELEQEIRAAYVPSIYVNLSVSVRTEQRFFYVDGEVKVPGRQPFFGVMTVLRAITTAGGFTDFADRKRIVVRRQNGQRFVINHKEALRDPSQDIPVYPNDYIYIDRKLF